MTRRLVLASLAGLALLSAWSGTARAQSGEAIRTYRVAIAIQPDGSLQVVERIAYDFGDTQHHGIFRDIPVRFPYDDRFDRVYPLHVVSVTATGGASAKFSVSKNGGDLEVKIGDANKTVTGRHTYTITYTVQGALNGFTDHVELYWNATGNGWEVPIHKASVKVTAPAGITKVACFAGPIHSSLPCGRSSFSGTDASFGQSDLGPGEGVTVVVGLPTGVVPPPHPILDERWSFGRAFEATPLTLSASIGLLLLVGLGLSRLLWVQGRDRRAAGSPVDVAYGTSSAGEQRVPLLEKGTYPVEYAPPDGIHPGQVGTLVDETANPLDVTATIVDLAVRRYIRIEEIPKHGLFGKPDWRLVQLKERDGDLLTYEGVLLEGLFEDPDDDEDEDGGQEPQAVPPALGPEGPTGEAPAGQVTTPAPGAPLTRVRLSKLKKHFATRLAKVQESLYADAVKRGWFAGRPDKVRQTWAARGWLAFAVGAILVVLAAAKTHLGLVPVPLALGGLVLIAGAHRMPRRTPKGTGMVRRVQGFRTYIETAEADEAKFAEKANLFSQYLPYAIVFGCTEKWAKAFARLDRQPDWYVSSHPFTLAGFSSSIDHFSVTSAGTLSTVASSGGSGFGGGGFSGGGGGGGGGGSW